MRRTFALALTVALSVNAVPMLAAGKAAPAQVQAASGAIQGTARSSAGQTLSNYTVQLRNVATGQLAGSTTSNAAGAFSFTGLNPANYVLEVVNQAGAIVGTSSAVGVAAGATVSVTVTASAAAAIGATAGGAAAAAAAAGGGAAAAGISTAVIITTVAAGAGIAGIVVATNQSEASPSR